MKKSPFLVAGAVVTAVAFVAWSLASHHGKHGVPPGEGEAQGFAGSGLPGAGEQSAGDRERELRAWVKPVPGDWNTTGRSSSVPVAAGAIRRRAAHESLSKPIGAVSEDLPPMPRRRVLIEPAVIPGGASSLSGGLLPPIQIELSEGTKEPLVLAEADEPLTPTQARAVAEIADAFADRVEKAALSPEAERVEEAWQSERERADAEYYALFGVEAFNRRSAEVGAAAVTPVSPAQAPAAGR